MNLNRIRIALGVLFELLQVEHLIVKAWLNQYVNIEIYIAQHSAIERRRDINVAVVIPQFSCWLAKTKNVVPAIEPIILNASCTDRNGAQPFMLYITVKCGIEYQKRTLNFEDLRSPFPMFGAIIFARANDN